MTNFRALMLGTVAAGLAVSTISVEAKADAKMISSGTDKTELQIKGHVNRAVVVADDGNDTEVFFADMASSETRMTITGKGKISEDLSAKAVIEMRFESNRSDAVSIDADDAPNDTRGVGIRHTYISFSSKKFGTLTTGQTGDAAEGASEIDLSGTALSGAYVSVNDVVGSLDFESSDGATRQQMNGVYHTGDGTRTDLIKYSTPSFGGLTLNGSMAQGGWGIVSAVYSGEFAGTKIVAGAGYSSSASTDNTTAGSVVNNHWVGSASALHESGISLTLSGTIITDYENIAAGASKDDGTNFYAKLGYQANLIDLGKSYFSLSYGTTEDLIADGNETELWQLGFVQKIDAAATELYLSVNTMEFDNATATDFEDLVWGIAGARVKF